jgi:uncharacterized ion transporter superfamily protein YfcC
MGNKSWCFGTSIGMATSSDNGIKWAYAGNARGLTFEKGVRERIIVLVVLIVDAVIYDDYHCC